MARTIIVPLDGSAEANAALPATRTLARLTGAAVVLVRVVDQPDRDRAIETQLARIADELGRSEVSVEVRVAIGQPGAEIVALVQQTGADLVVMRTHGRTGLGRLILGSVAQHVLAEAPCPLVLLRPGGRRLDRLQSLLVPVDGSPGGAVALSAASQLASAAGARVDALQVVVPIPGGASTVAYAADGPWYTDPAWDADAEQAARTYVDGVVARLTAGGVTATGQVIVATDVARTIVETADAGAADLVVMSSDALTGMARAVLGSVADAVVRAAPCPVFVIRRPATDDAS